MPVSPSSNKPENRAVLELISDNNATVEAIKLRRDTTIFGREKGDIVVADHEVSSTHCQICYIEGVYYIFDMNSTNGTFVNNERVVKSRLSDADTITIGKTSFRFSMQSEARVRHISTVFRTQGTKDHSDSRSSTSIVDTLIETEMRSTQSYALRLKIQYWNGQQEEVELKQRMIYLGRASSFGRFDEDEEISRKHVLIKVNDQGEIFVEDQGSTNGTFINGQKIGGMTRLTPKDELRIGKCKLTIEMIRR
jgi:pSer/pThr/pTyr-binding forkhead associated (FHA) protein